MSPSGRIGARGRRCGAVSRGTATGGWGLGDVALLEVAAGNVGEVGRLLRGGSSIVALGAGVPRRRGLRALRAVHGRRLAVGRSS